MADYLIAQSEMPGLPTNPDLGSLDPACLHVCEGFDNENEAGEYDGTCTITEEGPTVADLIELRDLIKALSYEIDQQHCDDDMLRVFSRFLTRAAQIC